MAAVDILKDLNNYDKTDAAHSTTFLKILSLLYKFGVEIQLYTEI